MNVMIVDDENTICNGVTRFLLRRWPELKVSKFNNGSDALKAMQREKPHLLITDIRMPEMSGLELIEKARKIGVERYAVLTGYDEFQFAQQAIRLRAQDYLLKPVDKTQLYTLVEQVMNDIEKDAQAYQARLITNLRLIIQYDIFPNDLPTRLEDSEIFGNAEQCAVVLSLNQAESLLAFQTALNCSVRALGMDQNYYFIYLIMLKQNQRADFDRTAATLLKQQQIAGFHVIPPCISMLAGAYKSSIDSISSNLQRAENAYRIGDREQLITLLQDLLCQSPVQESLDMASRFCGTICIWQESWKLLMLIKELSVLTGDEQRIRIAQWLDDLSREPIPVTRGVIAAVDVIAQQYWKELSLTQIAQQVYMAPSYLSSQFHKEMGVTFVEYINRVRVDRSCMLMLKSEEESIEEIAQKVGYLNTHYFFKVFRRFTGMTPNAFRQMTK